MDTVNPSGMRRRDSSSRRRVIIRSGLQEWSASHELEAGREALQELHERHKPLRRYAMAKRRELA